MKTGHLKTSAKHVFRVKRPSVSSEGDKTYQTILEESADNAATLKRFKDTVHEVENGLECGFSIDGFEEFQVDDVIECCRIEMKAKSVLTKGAQTRETVGYGIQNKQNKQQSTTVATER